MIKPAAMEPHLRQHTGRAVVFKDYNDMSQRIDDEALDIDANSVIVLHWPATLKPTRNLLLALMTSPHQFEQKYARLKQKLVL